MNLTNQQKIAWANSQLDRLDQEEEHSFFTSRANMVNFGVQQHRDPLEWAIRYAWRGDIEPLQKLYPKLAPFLRARKRLKQKVPRIDDVTLVAKDVKRIRDLWKKHPDKRIYSATAAAEIAIARWDDKSDEYKNEVTIDTVEARLKPSGPKKKKKPAQK